jgi:TonB family protein
LRYEQQGGVTLSFLVGADGVVKESRLMQSSGFPLLDIAAQEGIAKCRFEPARLDGKPVEAWAKLQYVWTLTGGRTDPRRQPQVPDPDRIDVAAVTAAAERGEAAAQLALARHHLKGKSAQRDPVQGVKWLRSAAQAGNAQAQQDLASFLYFTDGGPKDPEQSLALYRQAAAQGLAYSQYMLGTMQIRGEGTVKDEAAGIDWLEKAARQGNPPAQAWLADLALRRGDSTPATMALLTSAAVQGVPTAQSWMGWCHESGTGVPRNYVAAAAWFRKAADTGDKGAREGLARLYEQGLGVPLDKTVAQALRDAAAKQ